MPPKSLAVVDSESPIKYRYEAIIDYMLANPNMKQGEIARELGYTQAWFSQIVTSDGFRSRYSARRIALNEEQERQISAKLVDMANKASDRVIEELNKGEDCDASFALDAATRALRSIGFGAPVGRPAHAQGSPPALGSNDASPDAATAETLRLARQLVSEKAVTMTRVTERVEISSDPGGQDGRVIEGQATVCENG